MNLKNPGSKTKVSLIFILAVTVGILVISTFFRHIPYGKKTQAAVVQVTAENVTVPKISDYSYLIKNGNIKPRVSASAYLVGDLDTGETILAKNENQKFPIASVSKLMTALVALNTESPETIVQISKQALATEGKNGNFRLNEKVKLGEILYPLLLESSNNAAEAIAISAGRDSFIKKMNELAGKIGLNATAFQDPSGLSPNNISTTMDLFNFVKYLKDNKPELLQITTNQSYKNDTHVWFSNNQFVKENGYTGGKSGYTDAALETVVSTFSVPISDSRPDSTSKLEPHNVAITLLHSTDRHKDVESILNYLKSNVSLGTTSEKLANLVTEPAVPPMPEVVEPDFVTMTFAGDIMLDRGVKNSVLKNFGGDYSKLFDDVNLENLFNKSDVVLANLEGPASDQGADLHSLYSFRMDPSVIPALSGAGINILSVANNHIGDWGRNAFTDTLARLRENEILYNGGGMNSEEAEAPAVMEKYGIRLGFLGFSDKGPDFMQATTNGVGILSTNNPGFDEIIRNAAKQVDYLIVSFHFGEEYQTTHNARQAELAHKAIDDGAKIIIGTHPHVIEDTEVYKNGYIAYSLGNFIYDQNFSPDTMQGMLLQLKLNKDGNLNATKNIVKLNSSFQPDSVTFGKEEKVKFQTISQ